MSVSEIRQLEGKNNFVFDRCYIIVIPAFLWDQALPLPHWGCGKTPRPWLRPQRTTVSSQHVNPSKQVVSSKHIKNIVFSLVTSSNGLSILWDTAITTSEMLS